VGARTGAVEAAAAASDPRATLEAHVQLDLREEIRAEALVRNLPGFVRFLPVAGLLHGQPVNVSAVAEERLWP